jgi:hypothetical protein
MRSPARPGCWGWAAPEACLDAFEEDTISWPYQDSNPGSSSATQYQGWQLFHATPAVVEYEKEVTHCFWLGVTYISRIFGSNLGGVIGYPDSFLVASVSASMHTPVKSLGYVTSASSDILLSSFANDPTRAVQKFRTPDPRVTDNCPEASNFYVCSVRNMLHLTFLAPRILRWFLDFWKIRASLFYNSASYSPSYREPRKVTRKCDSLPLHFITNTKKQN